MFENAKFGLCLFAVHLISTLIVGVIFSFYKRKEKPKITARELKKEKSPNLLYESVYSAVISSLVVGGLITVFYLLTEILCSLGILTPLINAIARLLNNKTLAEGVVYGFFESTKGLKSISQTGVTLFSLPICASISGFGGLSVIAQSLSYLGTAKIKTAPFIIAKLTCAVISFMVGLLFSLLFF